MVISDPLHTECSNLTKDGRNIYAIMKAMYPPGYHHHNVRYIYSQEVLLSRSVLSLRFLKSMLHYLTSLTDIYIICFIHMQRKGTVVNGRSIACLGLNLVLDLNKKVLKFLVFLSSNSPYVLVFV